MLKRLGLGSLKGLLLGALIAAALYVATGLVLVTGSLGTLLFLGTGATIALVGGKPIWRQANWVESALRLVVGLLWGAAGYWLCAKFANFNLPAIADFAPASPWLDLSPVSLTAFGGLTGALIELENTGDAVATPARPSKRVAGARTPSKRGAPTDATTRISEADFVDLE